jgi:hypothetical protein
MQAGALSPTKLRMKLLGAQNRVRVISNSSARTSPSKSVEPSQAQNRLLVCDVLEEGTDILLAYLCLTYFFPDEKKITHPSWCAKQFQTALVPPNALQQLATLKL